MDKTPWRVNVLTLVVGGYVIVALLFITAIVMSVANEHAVAEAVFETAENIALVLFGGSVGIAKDLARSDDSNAE